MIDPVALARQFIEIPSVTGDEAAMAEACAAVCRDIGYHVELSNVTPERPNVLARRQSPRVVLCSHLDTVPPHIALREDDDWLYGRGACDTKGIIAAMLAAAERLRGEGVEDLGLMFVVGEETDSIGAKHANRHVDWPDVRFTIVGEPTESKFARAQKGGFKFTLKVTGKAAHSGYPERGASAVDALVELLGRVRQMSWGEDADLGTATANVGVIRGGLRSNIVAAEAEAEVFIRVVDNIEAVRSRVEQLVAHATLPVEWTEDTSNDPLRLATIPKAPATVVAFNTDAPHLTRFGKRLLVGPGSILDAHAPGERIAKRDILAAVDLYCDAVRTLKNDL